MFNQAYMTIIAALATIIAIIGVAYWYRGIANDNLERSLKTAKVETVHVKSVTKAEGITEKFEAIKPKQTEVIKHEEINLSIGKHSIFIK